MDYLKNHCWCSDSNWGSMYDCQIIVNLSCYEDYDKEDWNNLLTKEIFSQEEYEKWLQEANMLFKKIYSNPKDYNLSFLDGIIAGKDEQISFRLFKNGDQNTFEVEIDNLTFTNSTGEWHNAMIMLTNTIRRLDKEKENQKIEEARKKLKKYLSEEKK